MKTVVINSSSDMSYDCLFKGWTILHEESSDSPYIPWHEVTCVLLVGASSDVDPNLYAEVAGEACGQSDRLQDLEAWRFIDRADVEGIPVMGICKGAQQLCVYHGGKLTQHVPYVGTHHIVDTDQRMYLVEADHHQVMLPTMEMTVEMVNNDTGYAEIVWQEVPISCTYKPWVGIQYHPEWCEPKSMGRAEFMYWRAKLCAM